MTDTNLTPVDTSEVGNTKQPQNTDKGEKPSRNWVFTLNNPKIMDNGKLTPLTPQNLDVLGERVLAELAGRCDGCTKYAMQIEKGNQGTIHVQGALVFKENRKFDFIKKLIGDGAHIEKARNAKQALAYCMKEDTRLVEPKVKGVPPPPKPIKVIEKLLPWQQDVVDRIAEEREAEDDRTINWYWEPDGAKGKTALAKRLCVKENAIYLTGKAADCKCAIAALEPSQRDDLIAIFDYPREKADYVSYTALEEIKNGIFFNGKYESGMCVFNSPVVIIFANFEPDLTKLSMDRWRIRRLD